MNRSAWVPFAVVLGLVSVTPPAARSQTNPADLKLSGVEPTGLRATVSDSWGVLRFDVINPGPTPRAARVVAYYANEKAVQYARDLTVPGHASMEAWLPIGPAAAHKTNDRRELEYLLIDRTGGEETVVLPSSDERVRSRGMIYRPRAETTGLIVDRPSADGSLAPATTKALLAAAVFRANRGLSPSVSGVQRALLPPMAEAYDGMDQIILAGSQLLDDPAGRNGLRQWVGKGGYLWVMLDVVDPRLVAALLGDAADIQIVDRVGLTAVQIVRERDGSEVAPRREFDQPVDLVRVELAGRDRVLHQVNGWPASFLRPFGRGRILFTTLGVEAWHRPRGPRDARSPFGDRPDLPVGQVAFDEIAHEVKLPVGVPKFSPEALRPMLTEAIGYEIVGRRTAALFMGAFLAALLLLLVGLRGSRWRDVLGWAGPAAAVVGAALFVFVGERGRRAIPPTEGAVEIVDAVSGSGEITAEGLFAVYSPQSGPVPVATAGGGLFDLDQDGLEGQTRRRVQTDLDAWTWDPLSLPAGIRTGTYRRTSVVGELSATARFGPDGLKGRATAGTFRNLADGVIAQAGRESIAVRFDPDGTFGAGRREILAEGDYVAGAVLSDTQQKRQEVYRRLLAPPAPRHLDGRTVLFVWAEPDSFPFTALPGSRTLRSSLLAIPLEFERPAPGTPVYVPASLVATQRILAGKPAQPTRESNSPIEMRLRFQLPPSVVPMTVARAVFTARIKAPGWTIRVGGDRGGEFKSLVVAGSPVEPVRVEIKDPGLLTMDDRGGVFVHLRIEVPADGGRPEMKWQIYALSMELEGRTADR